MVVLLDSLMWWLKWSNTNLIAAASPSHGSHLRLCFESTALKKPPTNSLVEPSGWGLIMISLPPIALDSAE